ncbi:hypothetical protein TKWG_25529 (plasmid) [Advenella kashmirensis WT001]|uniref:Uncharacterized protein n=1 Tax=Advenella kashmirensis (strain DSM 17095 / LMG 22695 / WT001) TaxID=1036672 RepID=I3UHX5_ADVKW|nr:hypothetical protein TKWG_25529 [Advenella kashmirensis WT001]
MTYWTEIKVIKYTLAYNFEVSTRIDLTLVKSQHKMKAIYKDSISAFLNTKNSFSAAMQLDNNEYNYLYLNHTFKMRLRKPFC